MIRRCYGLDRGPTFIEGFSRRVKVESRLTWLLLSLVTRVPDIWSALHNECLSFHRENIRKEIWVGWLLKFAVNNILDNIHCRNKKLSLYTRHISLDKLQWLLHHPYTEYDNIPANNDLKNYRTPTFSWRILNNVFENIENVEVAEYTDVLDPIKEYIVDKNTTVLIVHYTDFDEKNQKEIVLHGSSPLKITTYACVNDGFPAEYEEVEFEVSYAAQVSEDGNNYDIKGFSDFKATGNGGFEVWTSSMIEKNEKLDKAVRSGPGRLNGMFTVRNCPIMVYTKKKIDTDKINRDYLDGLGNDSTCKCPIHDMYLINIPKQNRRFCKYKKDGKNCNREAKYRCFGFDNCQYVCCEIHESEPCMIHMDYKRYDKLSNSKSIKQYCKIEEGGMKCGKEASYKCKGYEVCHHVTCSKHTTEECNTHLEYTVYEDLPIGNFCQYKEDGIDCMMFPCYECPIYDCGFQVCNLHKDIEYEKWNERGD